MVAIGPLTNLAAAIAQAPDVVPSIRRLTIMGGRLGRDPAAPAVEYNLASDAEASVAVLSAGIPTTLVPLDVTWRVALGRADLHRLRASGTALARLLADAIERWGRVRPRDGSDETVALLHDPLTIATLLEPSLVTWASVPLRPRLDGTTFRLDEDDDAPRMRVAVAVDAERTVDFVLRRLLAHVA